MFSLDALSKLVLVSGIAVLSYLVITFQVLHPPPIQKINEPDSSLDAPTLDADKKIDSLSALMSLVAEVSEVYGVDSLLAFAIIKTESDFDASAKQGESGCLGLFQLNPEFFKLSDYFDPEENANWGIWFFKSLLIAFDFDTLQALTGYNYGQNSRQAQIGSSPYAVKVLGDYYKQAGNRGMQWEPKVFNNLVEDLSYIENLRQECLVGLIK